MMFLRIRLTHYYYQCKINHFMINYNTLEEKEISRCKIIRFN